MNRLRIKHVTGFHYGGEVTASYNEARMLPTSSDGQLVLYTNLEILPISSHHSYVDYWGTRVSAFEVLTPHSELSLSATSLVEVRDRPPTSNGFTWAQLTESVDRGTAFVEQQRQTARTEPPEDVAGIAADVRDRYADPGETALEVCRVIGDSMEYVQGVTGVQSTALEAWAHRKGVCQDIAHVALGALRSIGIPARYVSGYLHPKPNAEVGETVAGESHAWVEFYAGGWHGYDPTNQLEIGSRHVIVGRGRDYSDVAPLRGVYAGPHGSELFVKVEITKEP